MTGVESAHVSRNTGKFPRAPSRITGRYATGVRPVYEDDRIERPIYVAAILGAMIEVVKEKNFCKLETWLEFCAWVLSHPDTARVEGQAEPREESGDHPDWRTSRRAVINLIDACVDKDTNAPVTARADLANLLQLACSQFDWRLDHNRPVLLNRNDPIAEAINNTRSRAVESLINFGFWIRRHLPEDKVSEVPTFLRRESTIRQSR